MTGQGAIPRCLPAIMSVVFLCSSAAYGAVKINDEAPGFSLPSLEGRTFDLHEVLETGRMGKRGGVILTFFATWCGPCRNELPLLNALAVTLQERSVQVVAVDMKESTPSVQRFIDELKANRLTVVIDRDGSTAAKYQVRFLPTTFCIGPDGKIRDMIFGEVRNAVAFEKCAETLLQ